MVRLLPNTDIWRYTALPLRARLLYTPYWDTAAESGGRFEQGGWQRRLSQALSADTLASYPGDTSSATAFVVFPGSEVLFVLRELACDRHMVIGEGYVHGMMFGKGTGVERAE